MSNFSAGILAFALVLASVYFGFTKANPFAHPYEMSAIFRDSSNVAPRSPVRVAGIEVGKVTGVEPLANGTSRVRMELKDSALPLHRDATLKVRPRIFLGGNFFVDLNAGSPSAPELPDGGTIPVNQTAAPVQLGDVFSALNSNTRSDLQVALRELAKGLDEQGAAGLRQAIPRMEPAYRDLALSTDALQGEDPQHDTQRLLRGSQRTAAGFARDEGALKGVVTHLGQTTHALAIRDADLEASIPALRDTLRVGRPALGSLNGALPSLRSLAREALPGVRRARPTLDAAVPAIRQARALVGPRELRGTARVLRRATPSLVALVRTAVPLFKQGRAAARCTQRVLVPFIQSDYPDPDFSPNTGTVNQKLMRSLVGLAGESRTFDANQSYFHVSLVPEPLQVRPAPPPSPEVPPVHRPDVPCETQQTPSLDMPAATVVKAPGSGVAPFSGQRRTRGAAPAVQRKALGQARVLTDRYLRRVALKRTKLLKREARR
jgi:virulence factor Mce-like protein